MKKRVLFLTAAMMLGLSGCQEKEQPADDVEETVQVSKEEQEQIEENEQEEKEKQQEEKKEEKQPQEYKVKLSDKLSDFQFSINDQVWKLPAKLEDWNENGWEYTSGGEETQLDTESYIEGESLTKEESSLVVDLVNPESEKKAVKDCYIGGVVLEYKENGPAYQLPKGIILGKSVRNEVVGQYGMPTDEYEEKDKIYITYEFGIYKEADFIFDIESEMLCSVYLKNYREPESETETISEEQPEAVKAYEAPQEFSENPADYIASYDGQFYKIPAPVSEFAKNGWKIEKDGSDSYVKPGRHGYVTLEKDGHILYAVVKNYGDQTVGIGNSFVTNISGDFDVMKVPIAIAKEITLGMSEENMKIQLGESSYVTEEEEEGTSYYLYSDETKKNFIRLLVDKDLKLIREIEISNSPETLSDAEDEISENPESSALVDENKIPDEQQE